MMNEDELQELLNKAKWGDTIILPSGRIVITKPLIIPTNVKLRAADEKSVFFVDGEKE